VIGGKVLDASALAALVRRRLSGIAWFATAKTTGLTLYLPSLALNEVRAVRPDAGPQLAEVLGHPRTLHHRPDWCPLFCCRRTWPNQPKSATRASLATGVPTHWGIESPHWLCDTVDRQDNSTTHTRSRPRATHRPFTLRALIS
jgi:hypothetical protein